MKSSIVRLVRGRDSFGHPVSVNFKGEEVLQTLPGGIATLMVELLTLVVAISCFSEVVGMHEPRVTTYARTLTASERNEHGPYDLREEGVVIAFGIASVGIENNGIIRFTDKLIIPPEYGRIAAYTTNLTNLTTPERTELNFVPCTDLLTLDEIGNSPLKF